MWNDWDNGDQRQNIQKGVMQTPLSET
uniref:Uncharacterized protein n=1 Tax=Anguilla anguilla TaxID=7936 RepID=A0A0E9RLX1_ANGAN